MGHPVYDLPRAAFLLEFGILKFFSKKTELPPDFVVSEPQLAGDGRQPLTEALEGHFAAQLETVTDFRELVRKAVDVLAGVDRRRGRPIVYCRASQDSQIYWRRKPGQTA